ncbi:unnamed protein product [Cuscuta epithymum]|uniref:Uncharacterized protein n=1 Tax=Cuscuta epithymum TaxID=186058 RepID=A0AAV0FEJ4_9ASTE|nr:unnamed protein product [Cuscuta epithymum]
MNASRVPPGRLRPPPVGSLAHLVSGPSGPVRPQPLSDDRHLICSFWRGRNPTATISPYNFQRDFHLGSSGNRVSLCFSAGVKLRTFDPLTPTVVGAFAALGHECIFSCLVEWEGIKKIVGNASVLVMLEMYQFLFSALMH